MVRLATSKIAIISIMSAIGVAVQLSPRPPNVEFTSLITFVVGMVFGSIMGALIGALIMFVNGFLSPWGFGGLFIPFQMIGMVIVGFSGGQYGKLITTHENPYKEIRKGASLHTEAAVIGAFLTTVYQILMTVAVAFIFAAPLFIAFISSILFMMIHIASNTLIFGVLVFPLWYTLKKFAGG